jgi:hypothetical protein
MLACRRRHTLCRRFAIFADISLAMPLLLMLRFSLSFSRCRHISPLLPPRGDIFTPLFADTIRFADCRRQADAAIFHFSSFCRAIADARDVMFALMAPLLLIRERDARYLRCGHDADAIIRLMPLL